MIKPFGKSTFASLNFIFQSNQIIYNEKEFISQNIKDINKINILPEIILKGTFLKVLNAFKFTAYNVSKSLDSQFKNNEYICRS